MKKILDLRHIQEAALSQATVAPTEENYAKSLEHKAPEEEKLNILSFYLDGAEYAFEVAEAVEVLRQRYVTEVPRSPDYIMGIVSVRGELIPVVDLRMRLGTGSSNGAGRILVATVEDIKAGFIVDRLVGVKEVPVKSLTPESEPSSFLKGVIDLDGRTIRLLNPVRLVGISLQ